ncbi:hypothetical protein OOT46_09325 [Aquabacterium sp. A7-Y]|uniref:hypothetical protein n=1 Tax=Aquabacterium sp. A7-Y TaxID=1349605 RepID=UPI00223DA0EE|nr:hypothetical protein [Aquabacterium sp. A7-Y]MCW7538047.1 hypothetical protein [Aquabacterium sp. A7-Y]
MSRSGLRLKAIPFRAARGVHPISDVTTLRFSEGRLELTLACELRGSGKVVGLEVVFSEASGFRYLDELDLCRYWSSDAFPGDSYVLEVQQGGWADEESGLQGFEHPRREWLVVTGNGCVSVFSKDEPEVRNVSWLAEAKSYTSVHVEHAQ